MGPSSRCCNASCVSRREQRKGQREPPPVRGACEQRLGAPRPPCAMRRPIGSGIAREFIGYSPESSFGITLADDKILLYCAAECSTQDVCDRLDLAVADLFIAEDDPWIDLNGELQIVDADTGPESTALNPETARDGVPADTGVRAEVYLELLSNLEISTAHFEALQQRGLSLEEINKRGYKTADPTLVRKAVDELLNKHGRSTLLTVPGFTEKNEHVTFAVSKGMLIPARDLVGSVVALKVRHDPNFNGPKYTW